MSNLNVGETLRVSVQFIDYDADAGTDVVLPTASVVGAIYTYANNAWQLQGAASPIVENPADFFYYDWTPSASGKYKIMFTGTLDSGATVENSRVFYIGSAAPSITLIQNLDYYFLGEVDPLFVDPEIILAYYSDANMVEVTEIIHRLSMDLQGWFGENVVMTTTMTEWIIASVMCELSRIYGYGGGLTGFTSAGGYTLGDLTIQNAGGTKVTDAKDLYRGNVANWCELAALLRDEMLRGKAGMKAVVKGSNFCNPIPSRRIRNHE